MTGVFAGSQGTGVLEGSRPGTGATGFVPPPVVTGNENVLVELNSVSVGTYTAPFDLSLASVSDSLTTPVPNPIELISVTETIAAADVATVTATDDLATPVPAVIMDIAETETVLAADVATATATDALTTPVPLDAVRLVNSWATATAGSSPSLMTIPAGAVAGDVLVIIVGRGGGGSAVLSCVGSIQGAMTHFLQTNAAPGSGLRAFATIWDGVETFTGEHTSAVGQQGLRSIHAFRNAVAPTTGEASSIFGGTPTDWDSTSATVRTFPPRTVTDGMELLVLGRGLSTTGTSWSGGVTATAGGNSTNGNGGHIATAVTAICTGRRGVFTGSALSNASGLSIPIPVVP